MADITSRQAQEAKWLLNDAEAFGPLIALARELPYEILAKIRQAHDDTPVDMFCNARCEGLDCCIDILLEDPAKYAPEKIAEAQQVQARWQEQLRRP